MANAPDVQAVLVQRVGDANETPVWAAPGRGGYDVHVVTPWWPATVRTTIPANPSSLAESVWTKATGLGRFLSDGPVVPGAVFAIDFEVPQRVRHAGVRTGTERHPEYVAPIGSRWRLRERAADGGDDCWHEVAVVGGIAALYFDGDGVLAAAVELVIGDGDSDAPRPLAIEAIVLNPAA